MGHEPLAASNPRIKRLRKLVRDPGVRRAEGLIVLEGPVLAAEAAETGRVIECFAAEDSGLEAAGVLVTPVRRGVLDKVLDTRSPRPVAAVVAHEAADPFAVIDAAAADRRLLLVLDGIADPGNLGTLIRTAEAVGAAGVITTPGSADVTSPKVVRSSAGAILRVPVAGGVSTEDLTRHASDRGLALVGASGAGTPLVLADDRVELPIGLVLGSESRGISAELAARCERMVALPMAGAVESLNAAVAGSVIAFLLSWPALGENPQGGNS